MKYWIPQKELHHFDWYLNPNVFIDRLWKVDKYNGYHVLRNQKSQLILANIIQEIDKIIWTIAMPQSIFMNKVLNHYLYLGRLQYYPKIDS